MQRPRGRQPADRRRSGSCSATPSTALDWVGRLLGAHGRVLPMAPTPLDITAEVRGLDPARPGARHRRSAARSRSPRTAGRGRVGRARPGRPAGRAPRRWRRSATADWVVLGPGSWFTSVIPHLLVPELRQALADTEARVLVDAQPGGAAGGDRGLRPRRPSGRPARARPGPAGPRRARRPRERGRPRRAGGCGRRPRARGLVLADVARDDGSPRHDPDRLASAYLRILAEEDARGAAAAGGGSIDGHAQDRAHGDDGTGEGRARQPPRSPRPAAARPRSPRCCGSPAGCTSSAAGSSSRPSSTPAPPRDGCARTSPRSTATTPTS